jgi:predicted metal-dependent hydrolase
MRSLLQFTLDLFEPEPRVKAAAPRSGVPVPGVPLGSVLTPAQFRHPRASRETRLCEAVVAYEFKRGKRRTIGMAVGPDGLVVSAPTWVPLYEVEAALQEKASWIVRKLGEMRERQQRLAEARIDWRDGATLPFLGEPLVVVLDPSHAFTTVGGSLKAGGVTMQLDAGGRAPGQRLHIGLPQSAEPGQIRDAVQAWLMRQARNIFLERLDHFAPRLQVQWRRLSLSNAGTRWGSARSDGAIRLNWRLVHFKPRVIDYVVAHELSHLRVMDHSPRFWDTVRSVVPDYQALRDQLKDDAIPRWH